MELKNQLIFGVCAFLMAVNSANSLRCYMCSTDAFGGEFCKDPFKKEEMTAQQRAWSDKECRPQGNINLQDASQFKPVCKKLVQEVHGNEVIQRQCYFQDIHDPNDRCAREETPAYIKMKFCETCDHDYCNSAGVFAPAFILVLIPALLAKLFSL